MERKPFNTSSLYGIKTGDSGDAEMLIRQRYRTVAIRPYPPPRTTFAAITMLIVGSCLLIAGLVVYFEKNHATQRAKDGAIPMIALGGILITPGSYASYILYGAWKGWRGFDYSMIPSYDEE